MLDWSTILRADAMFFDAAVRNMKEANEAIPAVRDARAHIDELDSKLREIRKIGGDQHGHELNGEFESICIILESAEIGLSRAYGPQLTSLAAVQMLSAASIESYINDVTFDGLSGKKRKTFEKLSLAKKWFAAASTFGKQAWKEDEEPLLSLRRLVKRRNNLVHYKRLTEDWGSSRAPRFLKNLGLTLNAGREAVETVRRCISAMSQELGNGVPIWLEIDGRLGYFDTRYDGGATLLTRSKAGDVQEADC